MLTTLGSTRLATSREASSKSLSRGLSDVERAGRHVVAGLQLVVRRLVDEPADQKRAGQQQR